MDIQGALKRAGYCMAVVKIDGRLCSVVVRDETVKEPELKPVAIGGKPVKEE